MHMCQIQDMARECQKALNASLRSDINAALSLVQLHYAILASKAAACFLYGCVTSDTHLGIHDPRAPSGHFGIHG